MSALLVGQVRAGTWRAVSVAVRPATLVVFGLVVGWLLPLSWLTAGPSFCPFKVATGLPCPGCGLTRSAVAFLHGDISTSVYFHPLGALIVVAAVVVGLVDLVLWWRGRGMGEQRRPPSWLVERLFQTPAPWIAIGALAVVWAVRLPLYIMGAWTF